MIVGKVNQDWEAPSPKSSGKKKQNKTTNRISDAVCDFCVYSEYISHSTAVALKYFKTYNLTIELEAKKGEKSSLPERWGMFVLDLCVSLADLIWLANTTLDPNIINL